MQAITIRQAVASQCDDLLTIEAQCFDFDRFNRRQMLYLMTQAKADTLVAEWDGEIAAFCIVLCPNLPRPARLYTLAVRPEFQGRGVARALVERCISAVADKGYQRLRLEVSEVNTKAQKLYQSLGFESIAQLPGYYSDGSDGLRMQLVLSDEWALSTAKNHLNK